MSILFCHQPALAYKHEQPDCEHANVCLYTEHCFVCKSLTVCSQHCSLYSLEIKQSAAHTDQYAADAELSLCFNDARDDPEVGAIIFTGVQLY